MIAQLLAQDLIASHLMKQAQLTLAQLDTYYIDAKIAQKLSYSAKSRLRDIQPITKSSFTKTLYQTRRKISKTLYTILLLAYLGMIEADNLNKLLTLISDTRAQTQNRRQQEIINAIDEAIKLIAKGSRKEKVI